jgi:hypothetical protein
MPIQKITSGIIQDGAVVAAEIADGTITTAKLADANVTSAKLAAGAGGQFIDSQTPHVMYYNAQNVTSNLTVSANQNAFTAGPLTIDAPYSVTLNAGSTWVIL